ncbi:MAG TPA: radical SAM protein [Pyrinomonadaceae bacterium]|nr:radical SAM protein [Pyrinomonadaceae bacterium]
MITTDFAADPDFARQYIEANLDKRQVNKIQHSFPSPRYWQEEEIDCDTILEDRARLREMGQPKAINLYLGVPYCLKTYPAKCGYCLFPVEDFVGHGELDVYFGYLKREAEMYKRFFDGEHLESVYFGGGTSNLYKAPRYLELMEIVRDIFPVAESGASITLEGIPQLFTREKIEYIKAAGMNRISMGAQQLNPELNKASGRKQTAEQVFNAIGWAKEYGLACNVDLIFGWPNQTVATMVKDLEDLIATGIHDITHYELNVGGPTDFALNRYHELPSTLENLEMYRVSRDLLQSHGFKQVTAYNWRKPGDPASKDYEEGAARRFDTAATLGMGYAALSFLGDVSIADSGFWSLMNCRDLTRYKASIDAGRLPVERGFHHEPEDFRLSALFRNLFVLEVSREAYRAAFGVDVYEEFADVWTALEERDFVRVSPEKIEVVGDGIFYTPMIQTLLAQKRYRVLREWVKRSRNSQLPVFSGN